MYRVSSEVFVGPLGLTDAAVANGSPEGGGATLNSAAACIRGSAVGAGLPVTRTPVASADSVEPAESAEFMESADLALRCRRGVLPVVRPAGAEAAMRFSLTEMRFSANCADTGRSEARTGLWPTIGFWGSARWTRSLSRTRSSVAPMSLENRVEGTPSVASPHEACESENPTAMMPCPCGEGDSIFRLGPAGRGSLGALATAGKQSCARVGCSFGSKNDRRTTGLNSGATASGATLIRQGSGTTSTLGGEGRSKTSKAWPSSGGPTIAHTASPIANGTWIVGRSICSGSTSFPPVDLLRLGQLCIGGEECES
jgi:hypothetical protein